MRESIPGLLRCRTPRPPVVRRIAAFVAWWHGLLIDAGIAVWSCVAGKEGQQFGWSLTLPLGTAQTLPIAVMRSKVAAFALPLLHGELLAKSLL
jgi:hypothetical protein